MGRESIGKLCDKVHVVHVYDKDHMTELQIKKRSEIKDNGYKLNSHLTCFRQGFIARSVEHHPVSRRSWV